MLYTKGKLKIILTFAVLFLVISALLLIVYFKGNTSYKVTFDLDGGTLISGSKEQSVTRGQDAEPPVVVKSGYYLHSWSASYERITKDVTIKAVWEYDTTPGIIYANDSNKNYSEITGSYEYLQGDVFIGAYHNKKVVLGICENAFAGRNMISGVYLLNGLITIGNGAFSDCTSLKEIEIPETVTHIGSEAFLNCTSLEKLTLHEGLLEIGSGAFQDCSSLKEVVIPKSVTKIDSKAFSGCTSLEKITFSEGLNHIGSYAFENCSSLTEVTLPASLEKAYVGIFNGCENLTVTVTHSEGKKYTNWRKNWNGSATVIWPEELGPDGPELGIIFKPIVLPNQKFEPKFEILPGLKEEATDPTEQENEGKLPTLELNPDLKKTTVSEER